MSKAANWPPRTVRWNGWKTSMRLEPEFWDALVDVADQQGISTGELVWRINAQQSDERLTPAIRLFLMEHYRRIAESKQRRARAKRA